MKTLTLLPVEWLCSGDLEDIVIQVRDKSEYYHDISSSFRLVERKDVKGIRTDSLLLIWTPWIAECVNHNPWKSNNCRERVLWNIRWINLLFIILFGRKRHRSEISIALHLLMNNKRLHSVLDWFIANVFPLLYISQWMVMNTLLWIIFHWNIFFIAFAYLWSNFFICEWSSRREFWIWTFWGSSSRAAFRSTNDLSYSYEKWNSSWILWEFIWKGVYILTQTSQRYSYGISHLSFQNQSQWKLTWRCNRAAPLL